MPAQFSAAQKRAMAMRNARKSRFLVVKMMSREFGIRLYYLRTYRNYTQTKIAKILCLERSTYSKYEAGKTEPNLWTIKELARILDVDYSVLIDPVLSETEIADYEEHRKIFRGDKNDRIYDKK